MVIKYCMTRRLLKGRLQNEVIGMHTALCFREKTSAKVLKTTLYKNIFLLWVSDWILIIMKKCHGMCVFLSVSAGSRTLEDNVFLEYQWTKRRVQSSGASSARSVLHSPSWTSPSLSFSQAPFRFLPALFLSSGSFSSSA